MSEADNPLLRNFNYKHGAIPFDEVKVEHFLPALDYAIKYAEKKLERI